MVIVSGPDIHEGQREKLFEVEIFDGVETV